MGALAGTIGAQGAGGLAVSSSATTGPSKSGDTSSGGFTFGGINTGKQSSSSAWLPLAIAALGVAAAIYFLRKK